MISHTHLKSYVETKFILGSFDIILILLEKYKEVKRYIDIFLNIIFIITNDICNNIVKYMKC